MNLWSELKEKFSRFMVGRYGIDRFYHFLISVYFILFIINFFANSFVISLLEWVLLGYATWRIFSKNIYKRQQENLKFIKLAEKPTEVFKLIKCKFRDRKTHVYKKCPACNNNLRLPKQKGKHTVACPCCQNRFDVKI